jgi:hypothetical protein
MKKDSITGFKRSVRNAMVACRYPLHGRHQPKIFCIGFNKTGTTSLHRALFREGFKLGDQPTAEKLLNAYVAGHYEPIEAYCKTARAFQDIPFSLPRMYQPLYRAYPDAKFILSIRDSGEQWFASQIRAAASRLGKVPTLADLKEVA